MQLVIEAKVVDERGGRVILEVPGLSPGHFVMKADPVIVYGAHEDKERPLTEQESRDLEEALDAFHRLQVARALVPLLGK